MATNQTSKVIQHLRSTVLLQDGAGLTDGQLLDRFIEQRDDVAFAALVKRHGPMVWGVCRRILGRHHDAEDAFQAAFLVLFRKAGSVRPSQMVANWLYGVAHQTALQARRTVARRREKQVLEMPEPEAVPRDHWNDLQPLLDDELRRLPDKYRVVILLCDLEAKTRKEAARQLDLPEGTVAGRLARARVMLAKRLARRGVVLSGGALAAVLAQDLASAGMPTALVSSTIKTASLLAAEKVAAAGAISANVVALTEGVMKTMLLNKQKIVTVAALLLGMVAFRGGLVRTHYSEAAQHGEAKIPATGHKKGDAEAPKEQAVQTDNDDQEQARQADAKGRVLFARFPRDTPLTDQGGVGLIRMGEKKETLLFERPDLRKGIPTNYRLSPDTKKVAYCLQKRGGEANVIHVRSLDPAGPPEDIEVDGRHVSWSPDGSQLLVSRGQSGNVIVDIKTKKQRVIDLPPDHWLVEWSPDGKWFLLRFKSDKEKMQLAWMNRENLKVHALAGTEGAWEGRISPNGKQILFTQPGAKGATNLWVLSRDECKPRQITKELNCIARAFSWSPSGKRIVYTLIRFDPDSQTTPQMQETESFVMVSDLDGKHQEILVSGHTSGISAIDFTLWDWR